MTSDSDGVDDLFKIKIDKGNKHKRFFEKGLNALLADPRFLLLYVPENDGKMKVIRPANDAYHQERIKRKINESKDIPSFYYTLSHLWGMELSSEDSQYYWDEIKDYVDDEEGCPMEPVSVRPEKRVSLLLLLKDHPGSYWWIDTLCARTDTSLDITGDIYSCCLECIVLLDCGPSLIPELFPLMEEGLFSDEDHQYRFRKLTHLVSLLSDLKQCQWWNLLRTWQEIVLPFGEVRLMAETVTHQTQSSTITVDDLLNKFGDVPYLTLNFERRCAGHIGPSRRMFLSELNDWMREISYARKFSKQRIGIQTSREFYNLIEALANCRRACMNPVDYVYGVLGMFQISMPRMSDPVRVWRLFLSKLDSYMDMYGLRSMATFDYVLYMTISDGAHQLDLEKAENTADVYRHLLNLRN